jgi:hypothetical protein
LLLRGRRAHRTKTFENSNPSTDSERQISAAILVREKTARSFKRFARNPAEPPFAPDYHAICFIASTTGGMKLMALSANAAMVRLGFTPRLAATTDPSQMYMFL